MTELVIRDDIELSHKEEVKEFSISTEKQIKFKRKSVPDKKRKLVELSETADDAPQQNSLKQDRKSKRFIWHEQLQRLFASAVFDVGLRHASPKALMNHMGRSAKVFGLTTEHLKSHLQKYRVQYERSKQEFLGFYDECVQKENQNKQACPNTVLSFFPDANKLVEPIQTNPIFTEALHYQMEVQAKSIEEQKKNQEEIQKQLQEQRILQFQLEDRFRQLYSIHSTQQRSSLSSSYSTASLPRYLKEVPNIKPAIAGPSREEIATSSTLNDACDNKELEMRVAMQSQMNLHRQMLLRKVEVTCHGSSICDTDIKQRDESVTVHSSVPLRSIPFASTFCRRQLQDDIFRIQNWDKLSLNLEVPDDDLFEFLNC